MADDAANKDVPERWLKVTRLRERTREHQLGQAQAEVQRRRASLQESQDLLERQLDAVGQREGAVNVAELALVSAAVMVHVGRQTSLTDEIRRAEPAVEAARQALGEASRQRLVAQKWRDERRAQWLKEVDRKTDRAASDRSGHSD